jgi:hypothetical protein
MCRGTASVFRSDEGGLIYPSQSVRSYGGMQ